MNNRTELEQALREIEQWELEQKGLNVFEKLMRIPFTLLDKFVPKGLQQKLAELLDELGSFVQTGGRYLVQKKSVLRKLRAHAVKAGVELTLEDYSMDMEAIHKLPIKVCDDTANEIRNGNKNVAFAQGATIGFGGIVTLAADIPAILGIALKVIQETAISYGYDPNEARERAFIMKCMQLTTSDIVGKQATLKDIAHYDDENTGRHSLSEVQGWRETMTSFVDNFGWKKLFQTVPVLGMVFGSFMNRSMIHDMAETAQVMYRKRAIRARLRALDDAPVPKIEQ